MTGSVLAGMAGFLVGGSSLGVFQISARKAAALALPRKFMLCGMKLSLFSEL